MKHEVQWSRETSPSPSRPGPESPWCVVRERRETGPRGCFEARMDLRVAWAAVDRGDPEAGARLFRRLVQCLAPGQSLAVVLGAGTGRWGSTAGLGLLARGRDKDDALGCARGLLERVERTFGAFGPVVGVEPVHRSGAGTLSWHRRVRPARLLVPCRPGERAGFSRPGSGPGPAVALPAPAGGRVPVDALLRALVSLEDNRAQAVLWVRRAAAPLVDEGALRRALEALAAGAGLLWDGTPWTPQGPVGAAVVDALTAVLEMWSRSGGEGWELGCTLHAGAPLPPGVMALASEVVFGCAPGRPDSAGLRAADLSGGLPVEAPVPVLLPSPGALVSSGIPKAYLAHQMPRVDEGVLLGEAWAGSASVPVRLPTPDRSRHVYVVGATGTGKSTLLYNMIVQDIRAGRGVGLVDPHGDLLRQVLDAVPPERAADVVLVDPADFRYPPGLNLLETSGPFEDVQQGFVVNEMIRIFDRLYDLRQTGGPIFEQYMRNALLLALSVPGHTPTLLDVCRIFESSRYRRRLLDASTNPDVVSFWEEQAERAGGDASLLNVAPYVTSKLNQFTHNPILQPIIGQARSTVDLRQVMDRGQILLVNLSKGLLGDLDCRLLGMILVGKVFQAALARSVVAPEQRRPFHLFVDEFQNFTTETVSHMLSEARKFGLCLVLANQSLQQLSAYTAPGQSGTGPGGVLPAVLGNVATMIVLRTGPEDAPVLEPYLAPDITRRDIQELPDFHAAVRLLVNSRPFRPFVMRTFPPQQPDDGVSCARAIRRMCRGRYARPRHQVEAELRTRRAR